MNTDTTFIIADNQDITRRGMHGYISDLFGGCRTEDVADKQELVQALTKHNECLVIFDYTLFDMNDVEEFLIIEKRFPNVRWLLFSDELSERFFRRLGIERNIGMILKESSGEDIRSALKCMVRGERFICHQIADLWMSNSDSTEQNSVLTVTETDILRLIAHGKSVKEIAAERTSSVHTIVTHKKNIFRKIGVNNVYEATKYALRAGLVELVEYYI
jgi:DNA-binding NarL/FixJ family response regulator